MNAAVYAERFAQSVHDDFVNDWDSAYILYINGLLCIICMSMAMAFCRAESL